MSLNAKTAFQEELSYLHELGTEFSEQNPKLSRYLSAKAKDPDVERLLEGFAFLTSRIRLKLDDEFPELSHGLIQLLWPSYLRPIPAMTLMQFYPRDKTITEATAMDPGAEVVSKPIEGTPCRFRTCGKVILLPLDITSVETTRSRAAGSLEIGLKTQEDLSLAQIRAGQIRFHLTGESHVAQSLYLWIFRFCEGISFIPDDGSEPISLSSDQVRPGGFLDTDTLLPYPSNVFVGYRLLQELFSFPQKFLCFDLYGLDQVDLPEGVKGGTLKFEFSRPLPAEARVRQRHVQLHCSPAVNLFDHNADPIILDGHESAYHLRPSSRMPHHFDIFSVEKVQGTRVGRGGNEKVREFPAFESFAHEVERMEGRSVAYYRTRLSPNPATQRLAHYISFIAEDETVSSDASETITTDLLCTNAGLPEALAVGDICERNQHSPEFTEFSNLTEPTSSIPPPTDGSLYWILISNLSLNYLSLNDAESLRTIISTYDFRAYHDRQAELVGRQREKGIINIETKPYDIFHKGLPIRGLRSVLTLKESAFETEGEMYLFGTVISEFFSMYASINSFHELEVRGQESGESYRWPIRNGRSPLM